MRTHEAGSLRAEHAGQTVTLSGWVARRRDHGGVIFIDLREASGVVQVVFREGEMAERAHRLRAEFCLRIVGEVLPRPAGNENPDIATGDIEITATELEVLSESAPLPFPLDEHVEVGEETRLRYRYLDLRRSGPAAALRMRSEVNRIARTVLHDRDFVEVETPTLTRSTPEGARDFLVPARLQPGCWYALPQSPQLFKQLLMVAGMERYYQIARCYRDEDFRADRQPEFTQLDIEMSFVEQDDVLHVGEAVIRALWSGLAGAEIGEIPRLTYAESVARYGTDKPDLRFGVELVELTEFFSDTPFRVFQAPYVGAVVMPGGASQPRRQLDAWQEWAKQRGGKGLGYVLVNEDGTVTGPVAKNLAEHERDGLAKAAGADPGDCIFFASGEPAQARALLGAARVEIGRRCGLIDEDAWRFAWIVDFPMFERTEDGGWTALHHPFTAPTRPWLDSFESDPGAALAQAYDMVCNGFELSSGSVRIHRADVQQRVFDVIGVGPGEAKEKFGFLLDAFNYGPPPHAGIAYGWDRICMLLAGGESLREVIAFPKSGGGQDPLTGAPASITAAQRKEAGVDAKPAAPA
jgi:aspartyl-tRNA synthetase